MESSNRLTAKERRLLSRSEEETENEADYRFPGRLGWPKPLPVLPLRTTLVDREIPAAVRHKIQAILDAESISVGTTSPFLAYRHYHDNPPTDDNLTVVIDCRRDRRSTKSWLFALTEIRKALNGLDFTIEMLDFTFLSENIFPVLSSHPVVPLWESQYRQQVLAIIDRQDWQTLNVVRRGNDTPEECPVTMLITARDANDEKWWHELIPQIRVIWPYRVCLLSSRALRVAADPDINPCATRYSTDALTKPLQMGSSIGTPGERRSGTLGGSVALKGPDGTSATYALTAGHVVRGSKLKEGKPISRIWPLQNPWPDEERQR